MKVRDKEGRIDEEEQGKKEAKKEGRRKEI